jgi:hypothetical protein
VLTADLVITVLFLAVGLMVLSQARGWPFRASLFPLMTGSLLTLLALSKLVADLLAARRAPVPAAPAHAPMEEDEGDEAELEDVFATATFPEWRSAVGWTALYFVMLWFLGALVSVPAFAILYLLVASRESVKMAVIYAFCCWLFIYGLFDRLLHLPLPGGALLASLGF